MRRTPLRRQGRDLPTHRLALSPSAYTKLKAAVAARAGWRCEHPACRTARGPFDLHHVVKRSQGGGDLADNTVYLCGGPRTGASCHERTDWPYAKGRLVITPTGNGTFLFDIITKPDKFSPKPDQFPPSSLQISERASNKSQRVCLFDHPRDPLESECQMCMVEGQPAPDDGRPSA